MPAVFDRRYVRKLDGPNVKSGATWWDKHLMLQEDIQKFAADNKVSRMVMIWCGSTEVFHKPAAVHQTLDAFEAGLRNNDPEIAPSQIYAYAALQLGVPFANGAPKQSAAPPPCAGCPHPDACGRG